MKPKKGIYESIINKQLSKKIEEYKEELDLLTEDMDGVQASNIISTYLSFIMKKGLNYYNKNKEEIFKQIEIANKIIEEFSEQIKDTEFVEYKIDEDKILKGIFDKQAPRKKIKDLLPITSISKSTLFTGSSSEPTVYSELNKEIASADSIDLLVSFIKYSGLRLILPSLIEHVKTKQLRVITTSYMGATDYKAVEELAKLPNTIVKISYDIERTRLHAKAYYFHRITGFSTAYIGSSNISKVALTEGTEWNMKLSEYTSKDIIDKYRYTFESYWNSSDFRIFDPSNEENIVTLKKSLKREVAGKGINFSFNIRPYAYQQEILDKLEVERDVIGSKRNLIVAATGTGKTVISAFDFKRYYKEDPNCRFLFLAHRKEILEQSLNTFRAILRDYNFGDMWVGSETPSQYNHLFASVQTLNSLEKYKLFDRKHFNFIILDETHHGTASSYDNLLTYFKSDILLGLTATPERMDGEDITKYFNNRVAYEIRLHEAIDRRLLCPFHYFGVTDTESLADIPFVRGRYDVSTLSKVYSGNDIRASHILKSVNKYVTDIDQVKGIGFCVSIDHAVFMTNYFNQHGVKSISLSSNSKDDIRESVKKKLIKGEISFVFVVDLYNEGVDIPDVNTVLFLRPTESSTVFIQQLGRGLRMSEDKEVLTVLDFVGQASKSYNFRSKLTSLIGRTHNPIEVQIKNDFPILPKGCYVSLERKAVDYILENLKFTYANKRNLLRMIRNFKYESTNELTLKNFLNHYQIEPYHIYKSYSFYELLHIEGVVEYEVNDKKQFRSALKRIMQVDGVMFIDFMIQFLEQDCYSLESSSEGEKIMLLMFHYTILNGSPNGDLLAGFNKLKDRNPTLLKEIIELLKYNKNKVDVKEKIIELDYNLPLELYARYTSDQALAAIGVHTENKKYPFREGVKYVEDKNTDLLFITLNKSEKNFSESTMYEDYAISDRLFHWQSQSRTSDSSSTGQRYINQRNNDTTVLLFVREYKSENGITSPYYFLGKANYVSHSGSKPINIVWELEEKIPVKIHKKSNKNVG